MWLILSTYWSLGDYLVWYRPNAQGYTTDLNEAGRYTEQEAREHQCEGRTLAIPEEWAAAASKTKVMVANDGAIRNRFREAADELAKLTGEPTHEQKALRPGDLVWLELDNGERLEHTVDGLPRLLSGVWVVSLRGILVPRDLKRCTPIVSATPTPAGSK